MLEAELDDLLAEAKKYAQNRKYTQALDLNLEVERHAPPGSRHHIFALRFVGVCNYRLGRYAHSEKALRSAREFAEKAGEEALSLLIANHLGATLRRMGRPDEALTLFLQALRQATEKRHLEPRARLLGSLGALYDEAGQRALADDAYARYEEIWQFLDDKRRLANARGLMSRAELLRNRPEEAAWRVDEEERLADEIDDATRRQAAGRHRVSLLIAQAQAESGKQKEEHLQQALTKAEKLLANSPLETHNRVSIERDVAKIFTSLEQPLKALERLRSVLKEWEASAPTEERALLYQDLAELTLRLWLSGEALFYIVRSLELRHEALKGFKDRKCAEILFEPRFKQLRELANSIIETAQCVPRSEDERKKVEDLLRSLPGTSPTTWPEPTFSSKRRELAEVHWKSYLGNDAWNSLDELSRFDIVVSEVVYHGAVDDLGRAAHLLVVVFERELRKRFLGPVKKLFAKERNNNTDCKQFSGETSTILNKLYKGKKLYLQEQTDLLKLALTYAGDCSFLLSLRELCAPDRAHWENVINVNNVVTAVDNDKVNSQTLRNRIAHGFDKYEEQPTRVQVDAVRRFMLLDPDSPLLSLLRVDLRDAL